jgi:hypothetical protein
VSGFKLGKTQQLDVPLSGVNAGFLTLSIAITAEQESSAMHKAISQHFRPLSRGYIQVIIL